MENFLDLKPIETILTETFPSIESLCQEPTLCTSIQTGFKDFDALTGGLQNSTLNIIGGRPGMGKTALLLTLLDHIAAGPPGALRDNGYTIAFFSIESPKLHLMQRLLCLNANINNWNLKTGKLLEKDWESLWKSCDHFNHTNLYINDSPVITTETIQEQLKLLSATHPIDLVAIDGLQLIRHLSPNLSHEEKLIEIVRDLKSIATDLDIPVIVTSQLNSSVENRYCKRPILSDLKAPDEILDIVDLLLLLYREEYYYPMAENQNITELIIAKHRNGPTDTVNLYFQKETGRFRSLHYQSNRKR